MTAPSLRDAAQEPVYWQKLNDKWILMEHRPSAATIDQWRPLFAHPAPAQTPMTFVQERADALQSLRALDLAAMVELGKERDALRKVLSDEIDLQKQWCSEWERKALEATKERDAACVECEKLRALLRQVHSVMNDIPAPPYPFEEIEAALKEGK